VSDTRLSMHAAGRRCPDRPAASYQTRGGNLGNYPWPLSLDVERAPVASLSLLRIRLRRVRRRRLRDDLELMVLLQPVRVVAIPAIGRPARGLDVSGAPGLGSPGLVELLTGLVDDWCDYRSRWARVAVGIVLGYFLRSEGNRLVGVWPVSNKAV